MSRPSAKLKQGPKVISAIENTFTIDGNIETGIEMGSECQEVRKIVFFYEIKDALAEIRIF